MKRHPGQTVAQRVPLTGATVPIAQPDWAFVLRGFVIPLLFTAATLTVLANKAVELYQIPSRDSGVFAVIGTRILQGQVPYRDLWDHKPPGIYYTDALVFSLLPSSSVSLHLFEAFYALLTLPVFYWCARAFFGKAGAAGATFFFGMFSTLPLVNEGGNFAETYLLLPLAALYGCAAQYLRSPHPLWLVAAGALGGVATLYKPTAVVHLAMLAVLFLAMAWRQGGQIRVLTGRYAALSLGWLAVATPVLVYFWAQGALGEMMRQILLYNVLYVGSVSGVLFFTNLVVTALHLLPGMAILWLLAFLGLFALLRHPRRHARLLLALGWLTAEGYGALLGGRFYFHYFLLVVPPLALLSAFGLQMLLREVREQPFFAMRDWRAAVLLVLVVAFTLLPFLGQIGAGMQSILAASGTEDTPQERVAQLVREETKEGEPVLVWGAEATVYFLAGRHPPTRFLYNYPLVSAVGGQPTESSDQKVLLSEFMQDLARTPPRFIAVPPEHQDLSNVPQMRAWIDSRYALYRMVDGWQVFRGQ